MRWIISGALVVAIVGVGWLWPLRLEPFAPAWYFYDRHGVLLYQTAKGDPTVGNTPAFLLAGIVELEDQNFRTHSGVDFKALLRATWQNTQSGRVVSGASTITMQLARLQYLPTAERNVWYKVRQLFLALKLEQQHTKSEILQLYLESVNLGFGITGFTQGAQHYFSKSLDQLSEGELALLMAIVPNPGAFNPIQNPGLAFERRNLVLNRLEAGGVITPAESDFWQSQPLDLNLSGSQTITAPHFVFWVQSQLPELESATGDIHVHTTLDADLYADILTISRETIKRLAPEKKLTNSAVVVLNSNQELLAMLGSPDYFDVAIDGAVNMATSYRQTGSVLKPFLFAQALELGLSPADGLNDSQTIFPDGYGPRNFDVNQENGIVRFREALANSYNIAAVDLLNRTGVDSFYAFLQRLNLDLRVSAQTLGLSMALGSTESSLLKITQAFSAFKHQGQLRPLIFVDRVEDEHDQVLFEPTPSPRAQVMQLDTAEWITHVLSDNEARWRNFARGNSLELPFASAAKTGTSQAFRDNWVVGFSPEYTVGVWVGNADGTPMVASSGMQGAGPIWQRIMQRLHRDNPPARFTYQGQRERVLGCRRPQEANCSEQVPLFLTPSEQLEVYQSAGTDSQERFRISYPANGSTFLTGSDLLIQHRPQSIEIVDYRFNGQRLEGPIIENLPPGTHVLELNTLDGQSAMVQILVEDL